MRALNIIMALRCEADPLIARLGLSPSSHARGLSTFVGTHGGAEIQLVVSGVGKVCSAAATGLLLGRGVDASAAWLNVGIGGHQDAPIGTIFAADTVEDRGTGRIYALEDFAATRPHTPCRVLTVDRPDSSYPADRVLEMEASGMAGALLCARHRPPLCVVKVISDNAEFPPPARPNAASVRKLMESRAEELATICRGFCIEETS